MLDQLLLCIIESNQHRASKIFTIHTKSKREWILSSIAFSQFAIKLGAVCYNITWMVEIKYGKESCYLNNNLAIFHEISILINSIAKINPVPQ